MVDLKTKINIHRDLVGKTDVVLIGAEDEENLAIRYLASLLIKNSYLAEIVPCSNYSQIPMVVKAVKKYKPALIGISLAFQSLAKMYFQLVEEIRKSGFKGHITVGGHFPTFEYAKILETQAGIDSIIRFEGEHSIVKLAMVVSEKGKFSDVPNLVHRANGQIFENPCIHQFPFLDDLPFPVRKKNNDMRLGEGFATLVASRGCWHSSCLFCCIGAFHNQKIGKKFTLRSPESIAKEMSQLYFKKRVRLFQFHDDNFMMPTTEQSIQRFSEIKDEIEKSGIELEKIALLIKARPDSIDKKVGRMLKDIGVVGVFLGVENASETGLKWLNRKMTLEHIDNAINILRMQNIAITYNLLIFHPNSTPQEIEKNILFMKNNQDVAFDFGRAEIVAGSPLEKLVINEGLLEGSWPNWGYKIKNQRIDRMFRIHVKTFHRENSPYSRMAHQNIAFEYRLHILRRLHPGTVVDEITEDGNRLVSRINNYVVKQVENMYNMSKDDLRMIKIDKFYRALSRNCNKFYGEIIQLNSRMDKISITEKVFDSLGVRDAVQQIPSLRRIFRF